MSVHKPSLPFRVVKLYLDLVRILVPIVAVAYLVAVPYAIVFGARGDHPPSLIVPVQLDLPVELLQGPGFHLPADRPQLSDSAASLRFGTADPLAWLVYGGTIFVVLGLIWYAVRHLRALMRDVLDGRAFTRANALRLRRVGLLALGWQLAVPWAQYVWSRFVLARCDLASGTVKAPLDYDLEPIVFALAVLALAEIFGEAARLQEESDLTV